MKSYRGLPLPLRRCMFKYKCYLTGSVVDGYLAGEDISSARDFDVFVDPCDMEKVTSHLAEAYGRPLINSMGGLKFVSDGVEIDIWCSTLDRFLSLTYGTSPRVAIDIAARKVYRAELF